ncbi:MAG: MarR family transcriptional regulator [Bacteroidota bacterium]|nr:MarR family transcriptional regulator [Bacteroidota bacterium]
MSIENDIKQYKFRSPHQKALINLLYTHGWLRGQMSEHFRRYDITMQQYNVLRILNGQYPNGITTSDIRSRMLDKMSDASRLVDRLERLGLVEKRKNSDDRRLVAVRISEKGIELLERIQPEEEAMENEMMPLTHEEATLLSDLLDKLRGSDTTEK